MLVSQRMGPCVVPPMVLITINDFLQTRISMELYATTRLDKYFKDPLEFKPERWLRGTKDVHSFSHLQFGFGPRMCVGKKNVIPCILVR